MMKVIIVFLVLSAAILLSVYYFGGIASFDPTEAGRQAKAAMSPGMRWTKIVEVAENPGGYRVIVRAFEKDPLGGKFETLKPGGRCKYDYDRVKRDIAKGAVPDGFILEYMFSYQVAFQVWFDSNGIAQSISDIPTMADLLDTREGD